MLNWLYQAFFFSFGLFDHFRLGIQHQKISPFNTVLYRLKKSRPKVAKLLDSD